MAAGVLGDLIAATENWRTVVAILKLAFENRKMTVSILEFLTLSFLSLIGSAALLMMIRSLM